MPTSSSLYRKYRSQTFDELVGQEPVVRTLKNAIAAGRISHAYLFTGPRGVGKTSAARLLARAANCTSSGTEKPCNECPNCLAATRDIATDLIEIDAASNTGVDNIREVIERANFAPSVWSTKFYVLDEVHMLSISAFNALLKTLEEPPAHTVFVLATTEVHKVPATIASRCQRFDFRRISLKAMLARLQYVCEQEGIQAETPALELVARQSTGSLRDALSLLDQLRVFSDKGITLRSVQDMLGAGGSEEVAAFVDTMLAADMGAGLRRINTVLEEGRDLRQFNRQVVEHIRNLMLAKSGAAQSEGALLDVTDEMKARLIEQAGGVTMAELLRWARVFGEADASLRSSVYGQLPLEMAFIEATLKPQETPDVKDRSAELSAGVEQVAAVPKERPAPQRAPHVSTPLPPPVHSEPGLMGGNGRHTPVEAKETERHIPDSPSPDEDRSLPTVAEAGEPPGAQEESPAQPDIASTAPPEDASEELARLKQLWPEVVDQIKARNRKMALVYANPDMVKPVGVQDGVCTISFRDPIFAKSSMSSSPDRPNRDILESALSKALGYKCRVECITFAQAESGELGESEPPPAKRSGGNTSREKPSPYETSRGKAAINIFGIEKFDEPK